jgi:hypothetical protein
MGGMGRVERGLKKVVRSWFPSIEFERICGRRRSFVLKC